MSDQNTPTSPDEPALALPELAREKTIRLLVDDPVPVNNTLVIANQTCEMIVAIKPDGTTEFGPNYKVDDAVAAMWSSMAFYHPEHLLRMLAQAANAIQNPGDSSMIDCIEAYNRALKEANKYLDMVHTRRVAEANAGVANGVAPENPNG